MFKRIVDVILNIGFLFFLRELVKFERVVEKSIFEKGRFCVGMWVKGLGRGCFWFF